jgi:hypothetical protein
MRSGGVSIAYVRSKGRWFIGYEGLRFLSTPVLLFSGDNELSDLSRLKLELNPQLNTDVCLRLMSQF